MPYRAGGTPQGESGRAEIIDVYRSATVFINNVPSALHLSPLPSTTIAASEPFVTTLSGAQTSGLAASAALATSAEEAEVGLSGRGEVPEEPVVTAATPDPREPLSSNIFIAIAQTLDACLAEAKAGKWKETGSNPYIIACYNAVGYTFSNDSTPWCAGFAGSILKRAGADALKTLSSLAYRSYGTDVPTDNPANFRLNDIVIFTRDGGGHIGFFRGYNTTTGALLIAGGNQGDNLSEVGFKKSAKMPLSKVRRNWSIPAEYDKPVTFTGSGSSVKVV